jgi:hypothetical protein
MKKIRPGESFGNFTITEIDCSTGYGYGGVTMEVKMVSNEWDALDKLAELVPPEKLLVKCAWCGQFGIIKHPCPKCGGPIDGKL